MRRSAAIIALLSSAAFLGGCDRHPLLGTWTFSGLEQAWEVQDKGTLKVSLTYEDTLCAEGGLKGAVDACHARRKWARSGSLTTDEVEVDAYQFVIWQVAADTLKGRLDTCRCLDTPDVYYGTIENEVLVLFNSNEPTREEVARGKLQSTE